MSKSAVTMDELLASSEINQLKAGDVIEGTVASVRKHEVWIDLGANGVGVVMKREVGPGQTLEVGQTVVTSVVDPELDEGHALLSMRRAAKDRGWDELQRVFENQEIIEVSAYDANNAYQYVIAREETHVSWLQHALLDLGATIPADPARPSVAKPAGATGWQSLAADDARANQQFVESWKPKVETVTHARHQGMLKVVLGEMLTPIQWFAILLIMVASAGSAMAASRPRAPAT